MYGMINELPLGDAIEDVIRSGANEGRLDDSSFLGSGAMGSSFRDNSIYKYDFCTHGHFTYRQWLKYLEITRTDDRFSKYQDFMTFSFVRNPYDRMVSIWRAHYGGSYPHSLPAPLRFREFCIRHIAPYAGTESGFCFTNGLMYRFLTQTDFLVDDAGQIGVDFVGRIENLKDDYEKLRDLNPSLPNFNEGYHLNKSEREHRLTLDYQHYYYDKDIKEMIYDIFEEDFINFGYEK